MPRSYINKERFGDFSFQQARKAQTPYILIKFHRFWVGDLWGEWCYVCNFASMSPTKILISQWSIILNLQASSAYPSLSSSRTTRWRSVTNIWVRSKIRSFLVWSCLLITLSNQIKYRQIWNNPCGPILALGWVKMSITRSQRPKWCKTSISVYIYFKRQPIQIRSWASSNYEVPNPSIRKKYQVMTVSRAGSLYSQPVSPPPPGKSFLLSWSNVIIFCSADQMS